MSLNDYTESLVADFISNITDHVFLNIQHDDKLLRDYQTHVNRHGLQQVNMAIGRKIADALNLDNVAINKAPKSALIDSFNMHAVRK